MIKNICIIILVLLNLSLFGLFKYGYFSVNENKITESIIDNTSKPLPPSVQNQKVHFQDILDEELPIEVSFLKVNDLTDVNVFDDFYSKFKSLKTYEEYKKYSETYPPLLPLIYSVKLHDKEGYNKIYGFIFDKAHEEKTYFKDIEKLVGEYSNIEDLKSKFLNILSSHYDNVITEKFYYDGLFGDGPEHIALSADSIDKVLKYCDVSKISSVDTSTKDECYNYGYHYRATIENNFCNKIVGEYQKNICSSFFLRKTTFN